jgi:hypothetical protein
LATSDVTPGAVYFDPSLVTKRYGQLSSTCESDKCSNYEMHFRELLSPTQPSNQFFLNIKNSNTHLGHWANVVEIGVEQVSEELRDDVVVDAVRFFRLVGWVAEDG